jgi:transposase InsO family protein
MKFAWIEQHSGEFPIAAMCHALQVSRSGYFASRRRPPSKRAVRNQQLAAKISTIHLQSRRTYGSPRVHRELIAQGVAICENSVARLMREHNIRVKTKPRFIPQTTDSSHGYCVAGNLLQRDFLAGAPNKKWAADVTYIRTQEGWLYLAAVIDLFSRKVVGWSMSEHLHAQLVCDALRMALCHRRPQAGVLHHSDRGVQYACDDYQQLLLAHQLLCSMSGAGNCYDNAAMESFWATLKTELVYRNSYATREEARVSIFEYIEVFYNRVRRHSSIGYVSPEAFEAALN